MINYIRHDNEFYGTVKLVSGEEILGEMFAIEEDGMSTIYVSNPVTPHMTPVEKEGQVGMAAGFIKWMLWSDEEFFIVNEPDIITVAPMSQEAIMMYKLWWRKEKGVENESEENDFSIPINQNMGLVGKVSEARKRLEDIWKRS